MFSRFSNLKNPQHGISHTLKKDECVTGQLPPQSSELTVTLLRNVLKTAPLRNEFFGRKFFDFPVRPRNSGLCEYAEQPLAAFPGAEPGVTYRGVRNDVSRHTIAISRH
jgi:hypothetical protein